jgi:hypothetical protein
MRHILRALRPVAFACIACVIAIRPGYAEPPQHVLLIKAESAEKRACIGIKVDDHHYECDKDENAFFEWEKGVELVVVNRQFETDYVVQVENVIEVARNSIRGLEEVANLTISSPALAVTPPPAKGALTGTELKPADFLSMLLDEEQADRPLAMLRSELAELQRQREEVEVNLDALEKAHTHLTTAMGDADCRDAGGDPTFPTVLRCLQQQRAAALEPTDRLTNEILFRTLRRDTKDRIDLVAALQGALTRADLPGAITRLDAALTLLEQSEQTILADLAAARQAAALYQQAAHDQTLQHLRRDQLRVLFRTQLKADDVVDAAEINSLVNAYVDALRRQGFATRQADELHGYAGAQEHAIRDRPLDHDRSRFRKVERAVQIDLPLTVAGVNAAQSRLVETMNDIYDQSAVSVPLRKLIDLSAHTGKNILVTYSIFRTEGFARYQIVTPLVAPNGTAAPAATVVAMPPPSIAADTGSATSAAASTSSPTPPPAPPGEPVARGTFAVHNFDRASVVAAFVATTLRDVTWSKHSETTADGKTITTPFAATREMQQHFFLGIDYYFRPRDSFPGAKQPSWKSQFGVLGGVSITHLNNFFAGLAWEPILGINLGAGLHFGTETALQPPAAEHTALTSDTVPTYEQRRTGGFFTLGLDVEVFRKVFGKVVGIGVGTTPTTAGS